MSVGPDVYAVLASWWGGGYECPSELGAVSAATNLVFGNNPAYQVSDFLATYPKFGTQPQGLNFIIPDSLNPGAGYAVNDQLNVIAPNATGGLVNVAAVDTNGVPLAYVVITPGQGYVANQLVNALAAATVFEAGTGFVVGDVLTPQQGSAVGAMLTVNTVDGAGRVLTFTVTAGGQGYALQGEVACTGGHGSGFVINITALTPYAGVLTTGGTGLGAQVDITAITAPNTLIPQAVLQLYINLASSQLVQGKWGVALWPVAMGWFVAHYATLYLRSEGSVGTTAGQVAASGLTRGVMVSKSAGGVSATIQVPQGLEDWGAWTSTEYGVQLATAAKVVGTGMLYAL